MTDGVAGHDAYAPGARGAHAAPSATMPEALTDQPGGGREGHEIEPKTAPAASARLAETPELKYLRETRNAAKFIAVVVGIVAAISLVGAIIAGVQLSKLNSEFANIDGGISSCMSQGGTDPTC